jgi:large subunit ribosomal protein L7/L12
MSEEATKTVDLSETSQKIISEIETMSVLELSNLVKALEDKFGVVAAAAPVAVAAAAGESSDSNEGSSTVDVILTDCGDKKIQVLKVVREITGLGAKELVDNTPKSLKEGLEKEEAEAIKKQLEEQGAKVEFK